MSSDCIMVAQATSSSKEQEKDICRICLSSPDAIDKFFSPCNCKGTIGLMCSPCFRDYILSKTSQESPSLFCELCRFEYKTRLALKKAFSLRNLLEEDSDSLMAFVGKGLFNTIMTAAGEIIIVLIDKLAAKNRRYSYFDAFVPWISLLFAVALLALWIYSIRLLVKEIHEKGLFISRLDLMVSAVNQTILIPLNDSCDGSYEAKCLKYFANLLEIEGEEFSTSVWLKSDNIIVEI